MLQSELAAPPTDTETRSEAVFQRLLSTSSDLAQTLGLAIPGTGRGRTRKKSGLGNRYPESVGGGESDRDVGSRDRGGVGVGTKCDEDTTSSEDGEGDETLVLQKEATWDMELQVGSVGLERILTMEAGSGGSVMDVDMNDRVRPFSLSPFPFRNSLTSARPGAPVRPLLAPFVNLHAVPMARTFQPGAQPPREAQILRGAAARSAFAHQ